MRAFEAAVAMGYRYLETDAYACRDGTLLSFHDDRLDRVTDRTGLVAALDYSEVRDARVDGREPIPLMEDLLAAWPEVRLNIDPKSDSAVAPLIAAIRRTNAVERVCIGSFSSRRIRQVRDALGPKLCTSLGPQGILQLRLKSYGMPLPGFTAGAAQVPVAAGRIPIADAAFLRAAHAAGLQVHVWTIDDRAEMERLLNLGVDGVMTDRPALLKEVLQARGGWA